MPELPAANHFHLLLWPTEDGQLGRFMHRLTMTHPRRWQEHYREVGHGHLYGGRFKSFPVQDDRHFLIVVRYVERNALRAGRVDRAERWRWSSLWRRAHPASDPKQAVALSDWPVARPADWVRWVNEPQTAAEMERLRRCIAKGRPLGDDQWEARTIKRLGLQSSTRGRGRPPARANLRNAPVPFSGPVLEATVWVQKLKVTVDDQFGNKLDPMYNGVPVTENHGAWPVNPPISNGTYVDAVGPVLPNQNANPVVPAGGNAANTWITSPAQAAPPSHNGNPVNLSVEVGGNTLNPAIVNRTTNTVNNNGTLTVQVVWP